MRTFPLKLRLPLLMLSVVFLAGCEATSISAIKADPSRFANKKIVVAGTVTNSVGLLSRGGYEIEDGTGSIFVISGSGVPSKGAKVAVEGTVFTGATILGQSYGVAIRETKHRTK